MDTTLQTQPITVPDSILCSFLAADPSNADRIYRAAELVAAGHVERARTPGLWLVRSGNPATPDACYRIANGLCDCPDTARVGAQNCKHAIGCRLVRAMEDAAPDATQAAPCIGCGAVPVVTDRLCQRCLHVALLEPPAPPCSCTCHSGLRVPCMCRIVGCSEYPVPAPAPVAPPITITVAAADEAIPYRLVAAPAPRPTAAVAYRELYDGPEGGLYA